MAYGLSVTGSVQVQDALRRQSFRSRLTPLTYIVVGDGPSPWQEVQRMAQIVRPYGSRDDYSTHYRH